MKPTILNKQCIIWDWGGVCCIAGEHFSNQRMLARCGLSADEMSERCRDIEIELYLGKIDGRKFWEIVKSRFSLSDFTFEELHQSYIASYSLHDEVWEFIRSYRSTSSGQIVHALLSNLGEDMSDHIIKTHQLADFLSPLIFSHRIGKMKPDASVFEYAVQTIGIPQTACVFVDDAPANVIAARNVGLDAILFTSPKQALEELRGFGFHG